MISILQMSGQLIPILIVTLTIIYILLATVGKESFLLFTDTRSCSHVKPTNDGPVLKKIPRPLEIQSYA